MGPIEPVALSMLVIDHFKRVNETYGHAMGDVVITALTSLLHQRLHQSYFTERYGG